MNKHFEDTRYYLKRAAETAKAGVEEEIAPIESKVREWTGMEADEEVENGRLDTVIDDLRTLEAKAEGEAREAIGTARERLRAYRAGEAAEVEVSAE